MKFSKVIDQRLDSVESNRNELAAAAEVSHRQMAEWMEAGDCQHLAREAVNRIAFALAFVYDGHGVSSAIDHIDSLLAELLDAAGFKPYEPRQAA